MKCISINTCHQLFAYQSLQLIFVNHLVPDEAEHNVPDLDPNGLTLYDRDHKIILKTVSRLPKIHRSSCGVVDKSLALQTRGRKFNPQLHQSVR